MSERLPIEELRERFELLTGRFFDGLLDEHEDLELSRLLTSNSEFAKYFVSQVRIEHAIIGLSHSERLADQAFADAIQRSVELMENEVESERFAGQVVTLLRARTSVRSRSRVRQRRSASPMQPALIAAIAAVFMLALLITLSGRSQAPVNSTPENFQVSTVDLRPARMPEPDETPAAPPARFVESVPETAPVRDAVAAAAPEPAVKGATVEPPPAPERAVVEAPVTAVKPLIPAANSSTSVALASISRISGARVLKQKAGGAESAARLDEACFEADRLRVAAADVSPGELPSGPLGAEVLLKDGSRLWLQIGGVLTLHSEGDASRPILESGELIARIKPQSAQSMLVIRTRQGVEAAVLGTVFRLSADSPSKRVTLKVKKAACSSAATARSGS